MSLPCLLLSSSLQLAERPLALARRVITILGFHTTRARLQMLWDRVFHNYILWRVGCIRSLPQRCFLS